MLKSNLENSLFVGANFRCVSWMQMIMLFIRSSSCTMSLIWAYRLRVFKVATDKVFVFVIGVCIYLHFHNAFVVKCLISSTIFLFTWKFFCVSLLTRYSDSIVLTCDNALYIGPCVDIWFGSNASPSNVKPYDRCIVLAQASCIGNCFRTIVWEILLLDGSCFAMCSIGVQFGEISLL